MPAVPGPALQQGFSRGFTLVKAHVRGSLPWPYTKHLARADLDAQPGLSHISYALQCKAKPADDKYGFSHFARMLNSGKGLRPLPSDSRRRPDRTALEVGPPALGTQPGPGPNSACHVALQTGALSLGVLPAKARGGSQPCTLPGLTLSRTTARSRGLLLCSAAGAEHACSALSLPFVPHLFWVLMKVLPMC